MHPLKLPVQFSAAFICSLLLWLLPAPLARAETKPDDITLTLQTLEDFHSAEQTNALKPVTSADESYRSKLEKFQKTAQDAGNLKSVLAAKEAITELDAGRPPLVSDDAGVAAIQKAHIALRQKAVADSAKAIAKIDQAYLASLKKLVVDLTKAGKIEQAMEAQAKMDALAAAPKPGAANANPGTEEIEIWKKKALEEFPALRQPDSDLAKSVKTITERKKVTTPSYFKYPQWPYLLAKEVSLTLEDENKRKMAMARPSLDQKLQIKSAWGLLTPGGPGGLSKDLKLTITSEGRPFPVYKEFLNETEVFVIHPINREVPGTVDFSEITGKSRGTLVIKVHDHEFGDCRYEILKSGKIFKSDELDTDDWKTIQVPFQNESVIFAIHPTGWNCEFAFVTYSIQ